MASAEEKYEARFAATKFEGSEDEILEGQHFEPARYVASQDLRRREENCLRVVCISDTHTRHSEMRKLPEGDVLVHCGDATLGGSEKELLDFARWFADIPGYHRKICIAGNHDLALDLERCQVLGGAARKKKGGGEIKNRLREEKNQKNEAPPPEPEVVKQRFRDALARGEGTHYLEDEALVVRGLKFWGSPWQPYYEDWAFQLGRGAPCRRKWTEIPDDVDVLLVHGPPLGRGDRCVGGNRAGCSDLLHEIQHRVKPRACVFGHIHEAFGAPTSDGTTDFVNASSCTLFYDPRNDPVVLDLPLPPSPQGASPASPPPPPEGASDETSSDSDDPASGASKFFHSSSSKATSGQPEE
mmetsp:Transcript_36508/g.117029  ORF Transcript_36508/g.117029 Transcript_36508/m.117029 type:complete len:356 (-) Transcript_36508:74-1141(-)|eukprot:CAMPEP_0118905448 /NCGR_PEP_ID=MMETSP1166-20130328/9451_1 /TAXON_ID=1104430 /ORGANISM="Chrysoreinhardia sp, Strain CCMP3193" /LENGTH=355 /DNA_ID=CAMNT_0006844719 /DNA_START=85 /DNA_END=1152 /DNA_ORIENTATION=-